MVMGLRPIAVLGLAAIPLNYVVLKRLLAIGETVRAATRSSPRTRPVCRRSPGRFSRCSFSALSSAQSQDRVIRRIRSISMPAFWLTAGSPCSSPLLARVREGTLMREDLKGRCEGDRRQARRPARSADDAPSSRTGRHDAGEPVDPQDRQGARDPLLDARCDLRGALVPAWRHSPLRAQQAARERPAASKRSRADRALVGGSWMPAPL